MIQKHSLGYNMSQSHLHADRKARLFVSIMYTEKSRSFALEAQNALCMQYGPVKDIFPEYEFSAYTKYYDAEMQGKVYKQIVVFERLINPEDIAAIKIYTNTLEKGFSINSKRQINLDPGYLTITNVILVSTKNFTHRIYLGKGIYAELTLMFKKDGPQDFAWTYPDFKSASVKDFLWNERNVLAEKNKILK